MSNPLSASDVLNREFLEIACAAAASRRRTRSAGSRRTGSVDDDPRYQEYSPRAGGARSGQAGRAEQIQMIFSRQYSSEWRASFDNRAEALETFDDYSPRGSALTSLSLSIEVVDDRPCITSIRTSTWFRASPTTTRRWPRWAASAMSEPAFWAGFDRGTVDGFRDYFRQLTEFEPKRAAWYRRAALHLVVHQRQGSRKRQPGPRSDRHDPRVARHARRAGHRRDRAEQEHAQRSDRLSRARRPGDEDQRADPDPHAAPGRQVPGNADDPRHAHATTAASTTAGCWSITSRSTRSAKCSIAAFGPA